MNSLSFRAGRLTLQAWNSAAPIRRHWRPRRRASAVARRRPEADTSMIRPAGNAAQATGTAAPPLTDEQWPLSAVPCRRCTRGHRGEPGARALLTSRSSSLFFVCCSRLWFFVAAVVCRVAVACCCLVVLLWFAVVSLSLTLGWSLTLLVRHCDATAAKRKKK